MSLITRCPACSTMFKVVPDQLRISDGWVRCGQCDEVFDANAQAVSGVQVVDAPQKIAGTPPPAALPPVEETVVPRAPLKSTLPIVPEPVATEVPLEAFSAEANDGPMVVSDKPDLVEEPLAGSVVTAAAESVGQVRPSLDRTLSAALAEQRWSDEAQAVAAEELSFMAAEKGRSLWRTPAARAALTFVLILLVAVLGLQCVVYERDRIAAIEPAAKSYLEQMCNVMACSIEPLRQIDAVVIDSSAFVKVRGDVYRLSFALKNVAQWELAVPAVELTLTDAQDQAVIRRVFVASDFAGQRQAMGANAELAASVPISVKQVANADRIAGYRLVAFYP